MEEEILDRVNLNEVEVEPAMAEESSTQKNSVKITDPEWSDYVMTFFTEDELFEGNPTCAGLRRVAELLLGPITHSSSRVVQAPNPGNEYTAVVEHFIEFDCEYSSKQFTAAADVSKHNTDKQFLAYPTAVACTRAEAICLKKALKLKRLAAEEVSNLPIPVTNTDSEFITKSQIVFLSMLGERTNANVKKLLMSKAKVKKVKDVPCAVANQLGNYLNKVQRGEYKLENDMIGFDPNWSKEK